MKTREIGALLVWVGLLMMPSSGWAYTDQITVKAEEAWQVAQNVLKSTGFKKLDPEKKVLETQWVHDRVLRKGKGLLKLIASQTYDRRYRLRVRVTQRAFDSEIEIRGTFQERPMGPVSSKLSWKQVRPQTEDFDIERALFMRILNHLQMARNGR